MFPPRYTGGSILYIDPHVILIEKIDIVSLLDGSLGVRVTDLFTGVCGSVCGNGGIHVVGVDAILDVLSSVLSPSIESLLVGLGM